MSQSCSVIAQSKITVNEELSETYSEYGTMEELAPEEFLRLIPEEEEIAHCIDMSRVWSLESELQNHYLDPLWYAIHEEQVVEHDGRHRAMASMILGLEALPVFRFKGSIPMEAISRL